MFAVIEIQKNGASATPITTLFADKDDAYSKYHQVLAAAAISTVREHSAILVSEEGNYMFREKFVHEGE
jgi:hypothetical protein